MDAALFDWATQLGCSAWAYGTGSWVRLPGLGWYGPIGLDIGLLGGDTLLGYSATPLGYSTGWNTPLGSLAT